MRVKMVAPYFCSRCGTETDEPLGKCPRCGRRLQKTGTVRALGWVLVVLGGLLSAFMAWLFVYFTRLIAHSDDPGATTRFTGTASDATFAYGVFGVVLALGLTFVLAGVWQIVYGRRNKKIVFVALALVAVFYALGLYARGRP
jgi:magnesium-transporting ATPase (P-type)